MDDPHYVTPEEAVKKACPMKHSDWGRATVYCVGPKCMAWRWAFINWFEKADKQADYSTTKGYCGLVK